jgi:hypothetical protein
MNPRQWCRTVLSLLIIVSFVSFALWTTRASTPQPRSPLLVRSRFVDSTTTVFVAEVPVSFVGAVFCDNLEKRLASMIELREYAWALDKPGVSRKPVLFVCYGLAYSLFHGSFGSHQPTTPKVVQSLQTHYETCAFVPLSNNQSTLLAAWLKHQRAHLVVAYVHQSFDSNLLPSRVVSIPWPTTIPGVFHLGQLGALQDFLFRFRSVCEWFLISDADDFLVLPSSLEVYLRAMPNTVDEVWFPWVHVVRNYCTEFKVF